MKNKKILFLTIISIIHISEAAQTQQQIQQQLQQQVTSDQSDSLHGLIVAKPKPKPDQDSDTHTIPTPTQTHDQDCQMDDSRTDGSKTQDDDDTDTQVHVCIAMPPHKGHDPCSYCGCPGTNCDQQCCGPAHTYELAKNATTRCIICKSQMNPQSNS